MSPDFDYARLKRSFEYFVEHYAPAEVNAPSSHPVKLLEHDELSRISRARRVLSLKRSQSSSMARRIFVMNVCRRLTAIYRSETLTRYPFCVSTSPRSTTRSPTMTAKDKKEISNRNVDAFLRKAKKWREEFEKLRMICLDSGLTEELKWGKPCYTYQKSNVVLIHGFKEYCALLFMKGALLKDPKGILVQQTENVQAARQIRFTNAREIVKMKPILKAYIKGAIEVEKAGLEVDYKKTSEFGVPEEFQKRLDEISCLENCL